MMTINSKSGRTIGMAALFLLGARVAWGADTEPSLTVGSPAPKLQTGKWVQGEPVKTFESGKAYIVEFWATWCGPCRVTIPHLNKLHQKYKGKGLIVIGQDCWEQDDNLVAPFVKKMGDQMTYRVALDDKSQNEKGAMAQTWMAAAGQNGIPSAFLVNQQGLIAWIGHPSALSEQTIEAVLAGTHDVKQAAVEHVAKRKNEAEFEKAWRDINQAMRQKQWDDALSKIDAAEKSLPADMRKYLEFSRLMALFSKEDYATAYKLAVMLSESNKDDTGMLNRIAWRIVSDPAIKQRDFKIAETCAKRANELAKEKDASILDTLARVKFMQGEKTQAVALQEQAVALAEGDLKTRLAETLENYKKGELPKFE